MVAMLALPWLRRGPCLLKLLSLEASRCIHAITLDNFLYTYKIGINFAHPTNSATDRELKHTKVKKK